MTTKKIFLAGGNFCLVDEDDYPFLHKFKWHVAGKGRYATTSIHYKVDGKVNYCNHRMHRMINQTPEGMQTDHTNGDHWDNRKCNLRTVTGKQNCSNFVNQRNNKHLPGVFSQMKKSGRVVYRSRVSFDGVDINLGYFKTPEEAHAAYMAAKESRKEALLGSRLPITPALSQNPAVRNL